MSMPSCWPWSITGGEGHSCPAGKEGVWLFFFSVYCSQLLLENSVSANSTSPVIPLCPWHIHNDKDTFTLRGRVTPHSSSSTIQHCSKEHIARITGMDNRQTLPCLGLCGSHCQCLGAESTAHLGKEGKAIHPYKKKKKEVWKNERIHAGFQPCS